MEQFEGIRRDSRDRGMSVRALAKRHGVHRRTVRQALADATPPTRKVPKRSAPATGQYVDLVRRWLIEDLSAPRKQRHTARRIWQRLVEEEDARIGESTVRNLVARLRTEIGANRCQVMVPQIHLPASEAEVDFGEFTASVAGAGDEAVHVLPAVVAFGEGVPFRLCEPNPRVVPGWPCARF